MKTAVKDSEPAFRGLLRSTSSVLSWVVSDGAG